MRSMVCISILNSNAHFQLRVTESPQVHLVQWGSSLAFFGALCATPSYLTQVYVQSFGYLWPHAKSSPARLSRGKCSSMTVVQAPGSTRKVGMRSIYGSLSASMDPDPPGIPGIGGRNFGPFCPFGPLAPAGTGCSTVEASEWLVAKSS